MHKKQAGFTMIEIMVVVAIVAIVGGIGAALMSRMGEKADMRGAASDMVSEFKRARTMAKSGIVPVTTWPANARTVNAGIRVISATSYALFVDNDAQSNGAASEVIVEVVNMPTKYGGAIAITAPAAGTEIRFGRNGTLTTPNDVTLTLSDGGGGGTRTVTVTYGGSVTFM